MTEARLAGYKALMQTITWSDAFSVGNEELDTQHKEFFELIRESYTKIGGKLNPGDLDSLLGKISKHAESHFATEEKHFKETNYEHRDEHTGMHNEIRAEILKFKERNKDDMSEKLTWELVDFLESWVVDHIMKQDKLYAETFGSSGLH